MMQMPGTVLLLSSLSVAFAPALGAQTVKPIGATEFRSLQKKLIPKRQGKWQRIPWMTDMLAARRRAIAEKKPLFMWSMNGHPLGCT